MFEKTTVDVFDLYNELWAIAFRRGDSWYYHDEFSREEIAEILRLQAVTDIEAAINLCVARGWLIIVSGTLTQATRLISDIRDVDEPVPEIFYKVTKKGLSIYNALRP
jgi:hypothetical protein